MTPHLWKLQYNRNHLGMYESLYMKCCVFFYCVLFTVIDIDFCNFFIFMMVVVIMKELMRFHEE